MACHFIDNVHTRTFTPKEFQVELLDNARKRNSIVCLDSQSNKSFIILKLVQELSNTIRLHWEKGGKKTVFLSESSITVHHFSHIFRCITDLRVGQFSSAQQILDLKIYQVLCVTSEIFQNWITNNELSWSDINLLVFDSCHLVITDHPLREITLNLKDCTEVPHILAVTSPLFTNSSQPACVEAQIKHLENDLNCFAESASEIVSVLRFSSNPKELIVEYSNSSASELIDEINAKILALKEFLDDHRYDPSEIYQDEEFLLELKGIPDPKKDPYDIINDFLFVLETMGPWCADKAALLLLIHIEKLKVKTPYERHYLLLCLVSSHLLTIRVTCEHYFSQFTELERILNFSSPKILRLIEIIRQFKPKKSPDDQSNEVSVIAGSDSTEVKSSENTSVEEVEPKLEEIKNDCDEEINDVQELLKEAKITEIDDDEDENHENNLVINHWNNDPPNLNETILSIVSQTIVNGQPSSAVDADCLSFKDAQEYLDEKEEWQDCLSELITWVEPIFNRHLSPNNDRLIGDPEIKEITDSSCTITTKESSDWGKVPGGPSWLLADVDEPCPYLNVEDLFPIVNPSSRKNKKREKYFQRFDNYDPSEGWKNVKPPNENLLPLQDAVTTSSTDKVMPKWKVKGKAWRLGKKEHRKNYSIDDADSLVGIIFVERRFTAKVLFHLLNDLRKADSEFGNVVTQYTVEKVIDPSVDSREAEIEHKKQEQVLKRFRMRECNLLVATSVLEEGIELPRCNLVIRYDPADSYRSHAHSKATAKQVSSHYISMVSDTSLPHYLVKYAEFMHIEKVLLSHCWNTEPTEEEELIADQYTESLPLFIPSPSSTVSVNLATAISVVNKYCAKLPSDTFTRLSPMWNLLNINYANQDMYVCSIRLPINSPVKYEIMGHPMWNRALARRIAAMEVVRVLHSRGELDDSLEPIGKEAFNCLLERDEDYEFGEPTIPVEEEETDPETFWDPSIPRPGTTKSRQYYYKKIAKCLNDCRPESGVDCKLYCIDMVLTCPLPEEQNTRGRKLYPPEHSPQALGILTTKDIPKICPFPIFTRSGEVEVSLRLSEDIIVPTLRQIETMAAFLNFIFTSVLRLQKYLMSFDPNAKENSFFIVPTRKENGVSRVDWEFLELIYERRFDILKFISNEERQKFQFDPSLYADAVVMPWYRNQDQPQYFYVAEICNHLNAKSAFPGCNYKTFEDYYSRKYSIQIQNLTQPLLDVDHTSARLNFLTPRYVNRKGVALPTSSEETKRAKRENLEQKQILVPELCMVHVVPASLWRQAVCLPCILYRINALLLADQIRELVASQISLGMTTVEQDFSWPALDFGWSLADVLKKSKEAVNEKEDSTHVKDELDACTQKIEKNSDTKNTNGHKEVIVGETGDNSQKEDDGSNNEEKDGWVGEIGMWSNDMILENGMDDYSKDSISGVENNIRWDIGGSQTYYCSEGEDSDDSMSSWDYNGSETSESSYDAQTFKVTYKSDYLAEAEDSGNDPLPETSTTQLALTDAINSLSFYDCQSHWDWSSSSLIPQLEEEITNEVKHFEAAIEDNVKRIQSNKMLIANDEDFVVVRNENKTSDYGKKELPYEITSYGFPKELEKTYNTQLKKQVYAYKEMESAYLDSVLQAMETGEDLKFSFDEQPLLNGHPGPSPALILQALTMSNANDGINLERLETIGDSFLKYAITTYLYCSYENIHEGKLSHLRSKQVSNLNLYRLGRRKVFGESMIATKFEPHDNWLPPCYLVPRDSEQALLDSDPTALTLPYNLVTQHSIPDKSIADCVEALIGAYLIACGPRGALIFMSWLGIKVLPKQRVLQLNQIEDKTRPIGSTGMRNGYQVVWGELEAPKSPLLRHIADPDGELNDLLAGFDALEKKLGYCFRDRAYLLQSMTHASYSTNRITDCYQRLEFLGDAVLDYLITRHLYEDQRAHSPGALTDLRSALVNNTIFASLAVRHGLHKFFRHLSPALGEVIQRFVTIQEENSHAINEEYFLVDEEAEDIEVPKALGDVFESIAGAIFLDSNMSLDTVWKVYYQMMKKEIEQFSNKVPKSPIRELLELEPETAKFGKPEKLADGRRVRVTVEVFGKGMFKGIGRNYRIAKCTAAKCALKHLKKKAQCGNNTSRSRFKS